LMALPGTYTAQLVKIVDGETTPIGTKVTFSVKPLRKGALEGKPLAEMEAFRDEVQAFMNQMSKVNKHLGEAFNKAKAMKLALARSAKPDPELLKEVHAFEKALQAIDTRMNGNLA
ncbi:hypothetical protein RZS08_35640, partial [Arthrospira platensis SPKY1]|nr:hypothetical protein [Arthrospira platensis SPKY1]